jgi:hypothetical protein
MLLVTGAMVLEMSYLLACVRVCLLKSVRECDNSLRGLGQHEFAQLEQIMSRIDTNRDGHIDLDEFTVAVLDIEKAQWLAGMKTSLTS